MTSQEMAAKETDLEFMETWLHLEGSDVMGVKTRVCEHLYRSFECMPVPFVGHKSLRLIVVYHLLVNVLTGSRIGL